MNKLRTQIVLAFNAFLLAVVGGMLLFYFFFAEDYYIMRKRQVMDRAYESIRQFDLANFLPEHQAVLDDLEEQSFSILICNEDFEPVYSSKIAGKGSLIEERVIGEQALYTEDAKASYHKEASGKPIVLYGLVEQGGRRFYVYISENTRVMRRSISYANHFLKVILLMTMALGSIFAYRLASYIVRPVEKIQRVTNRLSQNDFSERIPDRQPNNELGALARDVNCMAEKIERNINDLNNYNYLLLRQNRDLAELEELRKKMVGRLTHELKTPLAIISSQVELLEYEYDDSKKEYYFSSIMEEIDKMSVWISTVLQNTKIECQIEQITLAPLDLSGMVEKLLPKYENWLAGDGIRFVAEIEPGCEVCADRLQIEQAVNNYMMNARRYTRQGHTVELRLRRGADGSYLSVYNEGPMLSPRELEEVWTGFYQSKSRRGGEGTEIGLGLYIVKDIMNHHDGSCGVFNRDRGVEFWLKFPPYEPGKASG